MTPAEVIALLTDEPAKVEYCHPDGVANRLANMANTYDYLAEAVVRAKQIYHDAIAERNLVHEGLKSMQRKAAEQAKKDMQR
jgi:hypothetical protein